MSVTQIPMRREYLGIATGVLTGPASYPGFGAPFTLDLSSVLRALYFAKLTLIEPGPNLPACFVELGFTELNDAVLQVRIKHVEYARASFSATSLSDLPSGVTAASTSGQTTNTESAHTHNADHDHIGSTSTAINYDGGAVNVAVGGPNLELHTHILNLPNFTLTTGTVAHSHVRNYAYDHNHASLGYTTSDPGLALLATGTDLSGTTWRYFAIGERL